MRLLKQKPLAEFRNANESRAKNMAEPIKAVEPHESFGMEIGGEFRGGVHHVYWWHNGRQCWVMLGYKYSLADAKNLARQFSAKQCVRTRLVSYWAEKVEELNCGSYVNSWMSGEAKWD